MYNRDGSLKNYDEELHSFTKEVLVTLPQFERIVCHCLMLLDDDKDDDSDESVHWLRDILTENNHRRGSSSKPGEREVEETDRSESVNSNEEQQSEAPDDERDNDSLAGEQLWNSHKNNGRSSNASKGKHKENRNHAADVPYSAKLKQVPSKIGNLVRADREAHRRSKSHTEKAALAALAKKRVDLISSMVGPTPYEKNNAAFAAYPVGPSRGLSIPSSRSSLHQLRAEEQRRRRDRERLHDTDSGRSVSEIAEAFLSGPIGKQVGKGLVSRTVVELHADEND